MKHLFIGLDIHKKTWAVTIQEQQLVLKRFTTKADADILIAYVSKHYPKHQVECCYEACCMGYAIYHSPTKAGWQVLVVNPADIPRGNKQSTTKTYKVDSSHLAGQLASGHLKGIYIPRVINKSSSEAFSEGGMTWWKTCAGSSATSKACCFTMAFPYPFNMITSTGVRILFSGYTK